MCLCYSNGTLPRASSRQRSSSSSGSKLTGSPATSITGGTPSVISSASPARKVSPSPQVPARSTPIKQLTTPIRQVSNQQQSPGSIITLQVSSRTSPPSETRKTNGEITSTTTSITSGGNSSNTRLCVLQSPSRSVVTLNGSPVTPVHPHTDSPKRRQPRPSSLYSPREKKSALATLTPAGNTTTTVYLSTSKRFPSVENLAHVRKPEEEVATKKLTNNNQQNYIKTPPLSSNVKPSNNDALTPVMNSENQPTVPSESMNNIIDLGRKKSETLSSLKNLLYSSNTELNSLGNSSAALKSLDKTLRASDSLNLMENVGKVPCSPITTKTLDDDLLDKVNGDLLHSSFPSLSDLTVHFKSITAQKIMKGISINSIDTLVEVNMAAANTEKQNNCDLVTIHTDFGML